MATMKKTGLVCILFLIGFGLNQVFSQEDQAEIGKKLEQLQTQVKELVEKMKAASEIGDIEDYNKLSAEYDRAKMELEALQAEAQTGNTLEQAKLMYNQGNKYVKYRQYQEALESYEKAIELDPKNARYYFGKGLALQGLQKFSESKEAYKKSIELDPMDADSYYNLGILNRAMNEYDLAVENLRHSFEYDTTKVKALYQIGYTFSKQKDNSKAVIEFEKAVNLDPKYVKAYNALGIAYIELAKYSSAVEALKKAVEVDPGSGESYLHLAKALNNLGEFQEALEAADKGIQNIRQKTTKGHVFLEKGNALEGLGNKADAVVAFQEAATLNKSLKKWVDWKIEQLNQ